MILTFLFFLFLLKNFYGNVDIVYLVVSERLHLLNLKYKLLISNLQSLYSVSLEVFHPDGTMYLICNTKSTISQLVCHLAEYTLRIVKIKINEVDFQFQATWTSSINCGRVCRGRCNLIPHIFFCFKILIFILV